MQNFKPHVELSNCEIELSLDNNEMYEIYIHGYFLCCVKLSDLSESVIKELDLIDRED